MNPQIEQLRGQFSGMNNAQRKQFIEKLKQKLQGSNNAEYSKFLNECIQKYNAGVNGGSGGSTGSGRANTSTPVPQSKSKNAVGPPSNCAHCGEEVVPMQKKCSSCFMPIQSNQIDKLSLILSIIGLVSFYILGVFLTIPMSVAGIIIATTRKATHKTKAALIIGIIGLVQIPIAILVLSVVSMFLPMMLMP